MKVNIEVYTRSKKAWDLSFLKRRKTWLSGTGLYVEFILCEDAPTRIQFRLQSASNGQNILIHKHSWNKFFINILRSGDVDFILYADGVVVLEERVSFAVDDLEQPVIFSFPYLLDLKVAEIRSFCNRISERLINGTRIVLYSPPLLRKFYEDRFDFIKMEQYLRMVFSIITERGLNLFVTVFDEHALYTEDLLRVLRKHVAQLVDRANKFRIVWDFSVGTNQKFLFSTLDYISSSLKSEYVRLIIPSSYSSRSKMKSNFEFVDSEDDLFNDGPQQILRVSKACDHEELFNLASRVSRSNQGIEFIHSGIGLCDVRFSLASDLYCGYTHGRVI